MLTALSAAPLEKSLHIILVRNVDGKTFWDALDEAVSPRIKSPTPVDKRALSTFSSIFQGRALKKGTSIFLTWLDPTKMLVVKYIFLGWGEKEASGSTASKLDLLRMVVE
ncbi:Fatty-acid-binding protein 3 [Forsythia ovata]|uniref:Fatty-acid-binding protein 3 n=1 Tax=Forsythia ovata TaxID=205694 RepID=A0ABD1SNX4_9LAMI